MKRILELFLIAILTLIFPGSVVSGQEKKSEQKIKIIIDDGSGEIVIIDTLIRDSPEIGSIKLKDGKVVTFKHYSDKSDFEHHSKNKKVYVTVTTDIEDGKNEVKVIKIVSPDSLNQIEVGGHSTIHVVKHTSTPERAEEGAQKEITWTEEDTKGSGEKVIIIRDGKAMEKGSARTYSYTVKTDNRHDDIEKTKYVIHKDGILISVEGGDYEKAKELIQVIEKTLDIKTDGNNSKESEERNVVRNTKKSK